MSDWTEIYGEINEKINANGIKAISGELLNEVLTKMIEAVDGNLPEAGTEYTAGANITITNGEIDTKRVVELTDITIADGASAIKIITTAGGKQAVAEGNGTTASGDYSHAEGGGTMATGGHSHAEGYSTTAIGVQSHAEGLNTIASGDNSHAEGGSTKAEGINSHAEGGSTKAEGINSHAEGRETIANHKSQHVFGEYNIADPSPNLATERGNYVEIVGKGTDENTRSNARTLDWDGNEYIQGAEEALLFIGHAPSNENSNGNLVWGIADLQRLKFVTLNSSTNTLTLPIGGSKPFSIQMKVIQDATGGRGLVINCAGGVNVFNMNDFEFSVGAATQRCLVTLLWDSSEWWYTCSEYFG